MIFIWLGLIIVLILLERLRSNYVTIFFVGSAIISFILSIFMDWFIIQFLVFIILGLISLVTLRDKLLKIVKDKKKKNKKKFKIYKKYI